ncbi:GLPGLI family protein [Pedobacter sp. Du54]|uniref:GLPGLI family protein n=1 Tax=Pedobacter anseongensis TaxID=3133439 RepID=UPI00309AFD09
MKLFVMLIAAFFYNQYCWAQNYKVEYIQVLNLNANPDTNLAILLFNRQESVYTYGKNHETENRLGDMFTGDDNTKKWHVKLRDPKGFAYYSDLKTKVFTNRELLFTKPVIVIDSMIRIEWHVDTISIKKIGDLICKKAVGEFRGRTYEVWFSEEIPVSFGPWKLWGLPGLIVEVRDFYNDVIDIRLKSIKQTDLSIVKPSGDEELTQFTYVLLFKQKLENLAKFLKTNGGKSDGFETKKKTQINVLERSLF